MADKKRNRRPPSDKIKPGTPHPTKAYTVRGYDGRWISRKAFNAAKRARKAAEKGSALVKRSSSALNKITNRSNKLLKINKGDKGLVRGIKDTYKFGKDTRKTANALYKAGKITREIHDKLVTGGKSFIQGIKELPADARRLFEKTKPGGKIVRVSKDSPRFKYEGLPKQRGGTLVKTPKTSSALTIRKKKPTTKTTKTTKLNPRQTQKKAWQGRTVKSDTAFNRRWKVKGSKSNPYIGKGTNEQKLLKSGTEKLKAGKDAPKPKTKVKTRSGGKFGKSIIPSEGQVKWGKKFTENVKKKPWTKAKQLSRVNLSKLGNTKGIKALNEVLKAAGKNKFVAGGRKLAGKAAFPLLLWEGIDETRKIFNPKDNLVHDLRNLGSGLKHWVGKEKGVDTFRRTKLSGQSPLTVAHNKRREKLLAKDDATNRRNNNQPSNNNKTTTTTTKTTKVHNKNKLVGGGNAGRSTDSGGTSGNNQKVTIKKNNKKESNNNNNNKVTINKKTDKDTRGKQAGAYAAGYVDGQKSKKKKRMHSIEKKNREIFGDKAVDRLKQKHKEWKIARKNGTLDAWSKKWKKK